MCDLEELQKGSIPVAAASSPYQPKVSYQKLELPVFDGKPELYNRFILQFEKITSKMNVDDFSKFTLL